MKNKLAFGFGILLVAAVVLAIIPGTREAIYWAWVSLEDDASGYRSYLQHWPSGRHVDVARDLYDDRSWADALAAESVEGFEVYLRAQAEGKHVVEATDSIEALRWRLALSVKTSRSVLTVGEVTR